MWSLSISRHRRPYLVAWLLVLGLVISVNVITIPLGYDTAVGLNDVQGSDRDNLRRALGALHLTPAHLAWYWIVTGTVTQVIFMVMGWLLVVRGQPAGFAAYLALVMLALGAASEPTGIEETYPDRPWLQLIVLGLTVFAVSGFFLLPLVFPNGRFVPRWTIVVPLIVLASFGLLWTNPGFLESDAVDVGFTLVLVTILIGAPVYRYHRVSTPGQRRQSRWVMLGFVIGLPAFFIGDAMMRHIDGSPMGVFFLLGFMILIQVGFNLPFLAMGFAILNHRLFDIDVVLSRTLMWLAMTVTVVGVYIGIVLGIGSLLGTGDNLVLSLLATGLVAVAFQPARARVQRSLDRALFGERDDPYAVLSRLGHRIEDTLSATDLLPQIVRTTADALRLPYVALFLDRAGSAELVAATGSETATTFQLPLTYQGRALGSLAVAPRSPQDAFSASDVRLLQDLARQIGIATYTVTLADELQRSREAIITSREEERRRLRRDLHDSLGAHLAALIMQTGGIRTLLRRDPEAAARELQDHRNELRAALDDVRRLVHGLRPPALDELGLVGAIRAKLDRVRVGGDSDEAPGLDVSLVAHTPMPHLPAAVEVATMHIVEEAVTNVVRHAGASRLSVTMVHDGEALNVVIADDGKGFSMDGIMPGIGLQSMRERARELGGTWLMERGGDGRGTVITVRLPAAVEEP